MKEVLSGFVFIWREGVNLSNLRGEGVVEVDFVVVRSGWQDVVSRFLGEDQGEISKFRGEGLFRYGFLCRCGKFGSSGDSGNLLF